MATRIAILGAGRMGREIIKKAIEEGIEVIAVIDKDDSEFIGKDAGQLSGIEGIGVEVEGSSKLANILDKKNPDVVIDFTNAEACIGNSKIVCGKGINMVIGTTGFTESQMNELRSCIEKSGIGAVISPNMSVGVNVFWNLIREATKKLNDYDIEIIELHHRFKKDSPSGTALKTAEIIARELNRDLSDVGVYGRKGIKERTREEIGIHAIRAGDIVGEHTVLYSTIGERIEIKHAAHSRMAFVNGVIRAVEFIKDKTGLYGMDDVLGLN